EDHVIESLGAYVLGALDERDTREVESHLAECAVCQAQIAEFTQMRDALGDLPPEAFMDGPPAGGDLVLQRTLRQMRTEKSSGLRTRGIMVSAAAAVAVVVALGVGVLLGKDTGSATEQVAVPPPTLGTGTVVPGTEHMFGQQDNVRLDATITPATG